MLNPQTYDSRVLNVLNKYSKPLNFTVETRSGFHAPGCLESRHERLLNKSSEVI